MNAPVTTADEYGLPHASASSLSLDGGAYDTTWLASLRDPQAPSAPRFPAALAWLLEHQYLDGSWGGALPYQHDRLLSTLAALRALARFPGNELAARAIPLGQRYIWRHAHELRQEPCELVGFELLLPALLHDVEGAGIALPGYLDSYTEERKRKLSMIPPELIYSPQVTLSHSLEFLGSDGDPSRLRAAQAQNGSLGNSPAATAYLLDKTESPTALRYLRECLSGSGGAVAPVLHPCGVFDALWSAYHELLGGIPAREVLPASVFDALRVKLERGEGIALDASFPIPDADDTAVAIVLLRARGDDVSGSALAAFEAHGCYVSFPYERHPSVGVNVHVLDALVHLPSAPENEPRIRNIVGFLADSRIHRTYWIDKWHISPYYATGHAVHVLATLPAPHADRGRELCHTALEWIRHTQRDDGSWGFYADATAEETAYAVIALRSAASLARPGDPRALDRAAAFLRARSTPVQAATPPLWIDKCLYNPPRIVEAAIAAALRIAGRGSSA